MGKLIYIRFQSHQCDLQVGQLIHFAGKEVLSLLFFLNCAAWNHIVLWHHVVSCMQKRGRLADVWQCH